MVKKLLIMQGLPGSGKSTWLQKLVENSKLNIIICSADQFFEIDGDYLFDKRYISYAHEACRSQAAYWLRNPEVDVVAIDNTTLSFRELEPYEKLASVAGAKLVKHTINCGVETAFERNIHKVPLDTIQKMKDRMVDFNHIQDLSFRPEDASLELEQEGEINGKIT